ncbi:MAG: substrate-binding domain-containing protein [Lautropia sp.]|nr:substrate-binding domain-containing protein [Lautropia sp.]
MAGSLKGISSMATRQMLNALLGQWHAKAGVVTYLESVGGVEAANRVLQAKEAFDLVFLASDALERLDKAGRLVANSRVDLARSSVAVAVPANMPVPDIGSAQAVREAVLAATSIGYSTGPSGVALQRLFSTWGIDEQIRARSVQAPPGVPVGALIAQGEVELGFQQLSELLHVPGIRIVGELPDDMAISTIFSGAVVDGSRQPDQAASLLAFMASAEAAAAKVAEGLTPL